MIKNKQVMIHG